MIQFANAIECVGHNHAPLSTLAVEQPAAMYSMAVASLHSLKQQTANADDLDIVRTMALCNLHFFLKHIAGYSGPYDEIDDQLQMEMCNWRQQALLPGGRFAGFVPRSSMKSTCWTHGAVTWELLRNPDLRVGIFSATMDRAEDFMHTVQRNFDSNDLMKALFPGHCPVKNERGAQWNDVIAVMPNRSRNMPEPSIRAHTASGTTAGVHVDLASFDDIVSDAQLTAARSASAEMIRIGHWFKTAVPTLLRNQDRSRVVLAATRYDIEDPYEDIMLNAKRHDGDWTGLDGFYPWQKDGEWSVFYRSALVDGESIMPSAYSEKSLLRLAKDDHWTYVTQYINNPHSVSSLEFGAYSLRRCELEYDELQKEWFILRDDRVEVALANCDVVIGIDPAASEKRVSRKTSRSAVAVIARDSRDCIYIIDVRADYVDTVRFMDWLFTLRKKYADAMRLMRLEAAGPFKLLISLLHREEQLRGSDLNFIAVPSMGEKLSTIRLIWEPYLKRNAMFCASGEVMDKVQKEFNVFPSHMLDLMDAIKLAIAGTHTVEDDSATENEDDEKMTTSFGRRHTSAVGY